MTERAGTFLSRRDMRASSRKLTQLLVLGYGIGLIALVVGTYRYLVVSGGRSNLWSAVAWFGAGALLVTLIAPFVWQWPEGLIRRFGNWLGHWVMTAFLVPVYFLLFWPVGALMRFLKGPHPIYEWKESATPDMEGWRPKEFPPDVSTAHDRSRDTRKRRTSYFGVLAYFVRRGHLFLIPVLVVIVSLGIALFFLQTSALAPFIYTLF